ncbi:putative addiction module antidote protein [Pseudomonas sp. MAFF 301350]|uniref:Addiction module antidote protein n=1 Tax=Pseudomonas aegrilactucae TaxID=2854028 RepID=A0A9Q2XKY8_9PSED|nr:putative addiction module antidote protein [Pseudomonas aegrilactucae]
MSNQNKPEDMPILNLNLGNTSRFEASRFLDTPETISAFLAEAMKEHDPEVMMQAIAEVAKAQGVNRLAQNAGVNRESLYKALKGGTHVRYDTVMRLMLAVGVELTVKPSQAPRPDDLVDAEAYEHLCRSANLRTRKGLVKLRSGLRPAAAKAAAKPVAKPAAKPAAKAPAKPAVKPAAKPAARPAAKAPVKPAVKPSDVRTSA